MSQKTTNFYWIAGAVIVSTGAAIWLAPKIIDRIEVKIKETHYDDLKNQTRKYLARTPEGKVIVGVGVFIGTMGLASGVLTAMQLYSKASGKFVSSLNMPSRLAA